MLLRLGLGRVVGVGRDGIHKHCQIHQGYSRLAF
jgi:hypothetical protein